MTEQKAQKTERHGVRGEVYRKLEQRLNGEGVRGQSSGAAKSVLAADHQKVTAEC